MEERIRIPSRERGRCIYGLLTLPKKPSKKVIILVHGMTAWMNDGKNRSCAKYFAQRGWATLRFNLYGYQEDAGTMDRLSLEDNSADIDTMIAYCKKRGFTSISVAGHSLGWINILLAKLKGVKAAVSWDGPDLTSVRDVGFFGKYNKAVKGYIVDWGVRHIFGSMLHHGLKNFPSPEKIYSRFPVPFLIIAAGSGPYNGAAKPECRFAKVPWKYLEIKGASHNFEEEGKEEELIRETFKWCKRWSAARKPATPSLGKNRSAKAKRALAFEN